MYLYIHKYYYTYICVTWRHLVDPGFIATFTFDLIPLPGFADEALNALRQILQQRVDNFLKFVDPATALAPEGGWGTGTLCWIQKLVNSEQNGYQRWWYLLITCSRATCSANSCTGAAALPSSLMNLGCSSVDWIQLRQMELEAYVKVHAASFVPLFSQ